MELTVGSIYRAKRPSNANGLVNDRVIRWMSFDKSEVQYDSPAVRFGARYPKVSAEAFLKWAGREIDESILPSGGWQMWDFKDSKNNK
jgi:hypothetical protein